LKGNSNPSTWQRGNFKKGLMLCFVLFGASFVHGNFGVIGSSFFFKKKYIKKIFLIFKKLILTLSYKKYIKIPKNIKFK
jgi:hypothetical protein